MFPKMWTPTFSGLMQIEHQTTHARGQSKLWNNRLRDRTMWLDCIPIREIMHAGPWNYFLFIHYHPFDHLWWPKKGWCEEKITCPLSSETMHLVVLVSDNFNLINCCFLSLVQLWFRATFMETRPCVLCNSWPDGAGSPLVNANVCRAKF